MVLSGVRDLRVAAGRPKGDWNGKKTTGYGQRSDVDTTMGRETVSKLGVLCGTTLLAARRLGESNVVLFECSVHNGRPHLEHEVCSSR
jgi:hypothetical protein